MESQEIRQKFRDFFEVKLKRKYGTLYEHIWKKSSSLISDDPSVLLTTAGMQQFKKYYGPGTDPIHDFGSQNVASIQKCFRTSDIDEVGDETHLTFFEMLGNFSFDGYFKNDAIKFSVEFLRDEMKIDFDRMSATYFKGDKNLGVGKDQISLRELRNYFKDENIKAQGKEDNFWGPTGLEGPCGPTVELCVDGIEIWNLVFNQYYCNRDKKLEMSDIQGVDTGMGLERLAMVVQEKKNIFETDLFAPLINALPILHGDWSARIVSDHIRGIVFLLGDGIRPGNKDQGYILRRLIRRAIPHLKSFQSLGIIQEGFPPPMHATIKSLAGLVIKEYGNLPTYSYLNDIGPEILRIIEEEQEKFLKVYYKGNNILSQLVNKAKDDKTWKISGLDIFNLVATYGFALEWIKDIAKLTGVELDIEGFNNEFKKHQEISRAGAEKKFGGHGFLLNTGELKAKDEEELKKVTRLHTATHLLQAALRKVLGEEVKQMGSDITAERTRFDFSFSRKPTDEELKKVEDLVNEVISKKMPVNFEEMPIDEAKKTGALFFFKEKYPENIKVYYVGDSLDLAFSKEFCGGPHVKNTYEIGHFKIQKSESIGSSTRRIRGIIMK